MRLYKFIRLAYSQPLIIHHDETTSVPFVLFAAPDPPRVVVADVVEDRTVPATPECCVAL
jgi:hypothetical protein